MNLIFWCWYCKNENKFVKATGHHHIQGNNTGNEKIPLCKTCHNKIEEICETCETQSECTRVKFEKCLRFPDTQLYYKRKPEPEILPTLKIIKPNQIKNTDIEISQEFWNRYLKPYKDRYRCFCDEQGIWSIKCKKGFIQPYSIEKKQLVAVLDFKTIRQLTWFKKKLQYKATNTTQISQEGDMDICVVFDEDSLKKLVVVFKVYKKKKLSAQTKEKLRKNLILARQQRKNKKCGPGE